MDGGVYKKSKGNAGLEGVQFQLDLLIVFLLNALRNHKNWKISSENQEAGKYDDLVIELSHKSIFVQSKFKQTRKITRDQLFSCNSKSADFSFPKYFFSYLEIKSEFKEENVIICTNTDVNPKGLENILDYHSAARDSLLHCEGATCSFLTLNENILPDLKVNAEKYFDENLQGKGTDKAVITDKNMKEFLKNFQFFYNYSSGDDLHNIIEELLSLLDDPWPKTSYHEIYRKVEEWFKQPKGEYLTEFRSNAMLSEIRSDKYCESLKDFNLSFDRTDLDVAEWEGIVHVMVKECYLLQILKIHCALQDDKRRKLFINPDDTIEAQKQAVEAFSLRRYTFLITTWAAVEDETVRREKINKIRSILEKDKYKKVILVANADTKVAQEFGVKGVCRIDGTVTFQDLSKESRERLLKTKNVLFQGHRVSLEELLHTQVAEDYTNSLDSSMLERLVRGDEVEVGAPPQDIDEGTARYYVSRRFESEIDEVGGARDTVAEEDLYGVKEKVIEISESAGMGKTTVLTKMAKTIKKNNHHLWVIKINLTDYTTVLGEFVKTNRNEINAREMLNSLDATKMTNEFEKLVFSISAKVVLMLDGVDEISPDYTDLVLSLLSHCQQAANFKKIFVTTRPHVDLKLKEVGLYKMLPLTRLDEIDFLTNYWTHNLHLSHENKDKCRHYAQTLIDKISSWTISDHHKQNPFTDIPLQVRMLAEIFQENVKGQTLADWEGCKEYLERGGAELKLPEKFNIKKLYDTFIEKQRDVFIDKGSPKGSTTATLALFNQFESYLAYHRSLSIKIILPEYEKLFKTQVPEDKNTEEYVLKIGIVQRLSGRVHFIHRTFAEYFLADSIVQELTLPNPDGDFQCLLIDELLRNDKFEIVRTFLDVMLQTSLPPGTFKNYRALKRNANPNLIFQLARNGHVAILRLILESIDFKVIKNQSIDVTDWRLRIPFRKKNTLNDLAVLVRQAGVNIRNVDEDTPLHLAVKGGHLDMVGFLVERGADVNLKDSRSRTSLHLALYWNNLKMVQYLVEYGADVNGRDRERSTVLHRAVQACDLGIVQYLIEQGASVNLKLNDDSAALHLAVASDKLNIVDCLLRQGADVNSTDKDGLTALHLAVKLNKMEVVEVLLEHGTDVNLKDVEGNTPLHLAIYWKNVTGVQYLLEHGAGVNVRDDREQTALHYAVQLNELDIVEHLVEHGANVNEKYNGIGTALHLAAYNENWTILEYLVEHGADVLVKDSGGHTVLHNAVQHCELSVVGYLLEHGADVDAGDDRGRTALHFAAEMNEMDVVACLLESGADVNVKDSNGRTALYLATSRKHYTVVEYLVAHSADVNVKDRWGSTALHVAVSRNELDIVVCLVKHGAGVNAEDSKGRTALHFAAELNNMDVVECLLEHGADVNVKDGESDTLIRLATSLNHSKIVGYLVGQGADVHVKDDASVNESDGCLNVKFYVNDHFIGLVEYLVEHGDSINVKDNVGRTALHLMIQNDLLNLVDYLDAIRPAR